MSHWTARICLAACLLAFVACGPKPANLVVAYLDRAELQVENAAQRQEIRRTLKDLLDLPVSEARIRRYADYRGQVDAWSATQLVQKYYVPPKPMGLDEEHFYRDVAAPEARAVIERRLKELN